MMLTRPKAWLAAMALPWAEVMGSNLADSLVTHAYGSVMVFQAV